MPDLTTAARSTFTTALMALLKLCVMLATTTTPMLPAMLPKTKCICMWPLRGWDGRGDDDDGGVAVLFFWIQNQLFERGT